MGLCISYSGSLDDLSKLDELISDVRRFCRTLAWTVEDNSEHLSGVLLGKWDDKRKAEASDKPRRGRTPKMGLQFRLPKGRTPKLIEETLRGVIVHPPGTDSLALRFDGKGKLSNYAVFPEEIVVNAVAGEQHYFGFPLFVKTTGEVESHVGICALFKMLRKYMSNLKVSDDGGFWETWDVQELRKRHREMGLLVGIFSNLKQR